MLAGWRWSTGALAQLNAACLPPAKAPTVLSTADRLTTLSGGATYSGDYRVQGDLLLTNGTYITPNTTFYVDGAASKTPLAGGDYVRSVTSGTITVGRNATLVLDGATLTAAGSATSCPMWRGVVLDCARQGPSGPYRLVVQNNSTISHALCAIRMKDDAFAGTSSYRLDHSTFAHNLTHVYDNASHISPQPSFIASCLFVSVPDQMHFPYEQMAGWSQFLYLPGPNDNPYRLVC